MGMFDDLIPKGAPQGGRFDDLVPTQPAMSSGNRPPEEMRSGPPINMDWQDVASGAFKNLPRSAVQLVKDMVHPIMHPVDTAKTVGELGLGVMQKAIPGEQSSEPTANAVGQFLMDRYGGAAEIKRTLATDPAGILSDLSMFFSGGAAAAGRVPALGGKVTKAVGAAADFMDPIAAPVKAASSVSKSYLPDVIGGVGTHTGGESIRQAWKVGEEGGKNADLFLGNMRHDIPMSSVVDDAKTAVEKMGRARGDTYRADMASIGQDKTVLDFKPIDDALAKSAEIGMYKGVDIKPASAGVRKELDDAISRWRALDPAEYHTVEGIDALKKQVGDIRDNTPFGSPQRKAANDVYRAVREQIVNQAPEYGKAMQKYEEASDLIEEIGRALSLNPKANVDTSLRKLQSLMRNNVNTNYGNRLDLARQMPDADPILAQLAGQSLSSVTPRGLGPLVAGSTVAGAAVNPWALATLPLQSPRLVGEASYYGGKLSSALARPMQAVPPQVVERASIQAGRTDDRVRSRFANMLLNR